MLIFYCTSCNETIAAADDESTRQIGDRLDEHITKCPPATFTYEGTSTLPGEGFAIYDHFLKSVLRAR